MTMLTPIASRDLPSNLFVYGPHYGYLGVLDRLEVSRLARQVSPCSQRCSTLDALGEIQSRNRTV